MRGLMWFKKDLRTYDNPALYHAANENADGIIAIYFIDYSMWKRNSTAPRQVEFIQQTLLILQNDLAQLNITLIIQEVAETNDIPLTFLRLIEQYKIDQVYFNKEYEINESRRDKAVVTLLEKNKINTFIFDDQMIVPADALRTQQDNYFKMFTPFKKTWLNTLDKNPELKILWPRVKKQKALLVEIKPYQPLADAKNGWIAGEHAAKKRLEEFVQQRIANYTVDRDYPAINGTSQLSPYLAVGNISVKSCFVAALQVNNKDLFAGNPGALTWMSELIWREFYRYILIYNPRVCMGQALKSLTEKLPWVYDDELLLAWQTGQTGYPIIDAAMRQLNTTGWMHNRLRMLTAMFLSKNLFINWRLGEKYFAENLIDCDFAANNGGWQWCASTGTDSAPYFRVFNPFTQSAKFDANGDFIRQYCPELASCSNKTIHNPHEFGVTGLKYPAPIIDYKYSRQRIIAAFKAL